MASWVINLLVTLFENAVALPILAGHHNTRIQMTNGLKQGCPLSPLLFCLALDPLISAITKCHIDVRAYVDDIACGSPAIAPFALALPHFDRFNAASGSATSHTKSGLIATGSLDQAQLSLDLPPNWRFLLLKDRDKYLGIPFGREVMVSDVFTKPLQLLCTRLDLYMPLCRCSYSLGERVITANTFLLQGSFPPWLYPAPFCDARPLD